MKYEPAFFYYERSLGKWHPVCVFGDPPKKERLSDDDPSMMSRYWRVEDVDRDSTGEPMWGRLQARYPHPVEG